MAILKSRNSLEDLRTEGSIIAALEDWANVSDRMGLRTIWSKEGRLEGNFEKLRDEASVDKRTCLHLWLTSLKI